ncbi:MAG: PAS domain S-box protein [Alphaproteobacteria bacterium]|nr:PAS domain S-box protein [Alphaproteobacteria bacterium]
MKPKHTQLLASILVPVYQDLPAMAIMNAVVAGFVASALYTEIAPSTLALWLGGVCLVSAARLVLWYWQRQHPITPGRARRWANWLVLGSAASGSLWGAAGILFFLPDNPFLQLFLLLVLGGMTAGALATSSQYMPAYYAFALTAVLPIGIRVVAIGDSFYLTMGALIMIYLAVMVGLSRRIGKSFAAVTALQIERDAVATRFQDFAEASSDWFWEMDAELRLSFVSRRMNLADGLDPTTLLDLEAHEILQHRSSPEEWRHLRENLAKRRPFRNFVCRYRTATGEPCFFQMSGKPLFDAEGRFTGYRGVATDITMERRAQEALREEQERLRDTIDNVFDGIVTIDEDGRVRSVNPAVAGMFGYTVEECIGQPFFEAFVPISYKGDASSGGGLTASLQSLNMASSIRENVALRKDGSIFYVDLAMSRMMYRGEELRIAVVRDITQQKELHAQLLQASKLGILGEMAAGVTYELSQPLNVIRMAAENALLSESAKLPGTKFAQEKFALIAQQSQKMGETIHHLRVFSRKDGEQTERFYVSWIIEQAVQLVESSFSLEDIQIVAELPDEPVMVKGSVSRFEQVLLSLLHNAKGSILRRWHEKGDGAETGEITVRVRPSKDGQTVRIVILDDGLGIPSEHLDRVFDPAFATQESGRVSGLGLFIVHGIVTAMGGDITASNGPIGTRFMITLPCTIDAEAKPMDVRLSGN